MIAIDGIHGIVDLDTSTTCSVSASLQQNPHARIGRLARQLLHDKPPVAADPQNGEKPKEQAKESEEKEKKKKRDRPGNASKKQLRP